MTTQYVLACGLNYLVVHFNVKFILYEREMWHKEGDLKWVHPLPKDLRYKRENDIKEVRV